MHPAARAAVYSVVGSIADATFSAIHDRLRGKPVRLRTSLWMLPIYGLIQPLFEPLHDSLRRRNVLVRSTSYGIGFMTVEYISGSLLRRTRGEAPWDYSDAHLHVNGLIRPDYIFYWATAGLALEHLHDVLD